MTAPVPDPRPTVCLCDGRPGPHGYGDSGCLDAVPDPRFRDQLAEALAPWLPRYGLSDFRREHAAAALLPLIAAEVEAHVQAAANQRAVEIDVERAARAMHEIPAQPGVYGRIPWERLMEQHREAYRQMARAAAAALSSPAPAPDGA